MGTTTPRYHVQDPHDSVRSLDSYAKTDLMDPHTININVLRRHDPEISHIVDTTSYVVLYRFSHGSWAKTGLEGTLFIFQRGSPPYFGVFVLNRQGLDNFCEPLRNGWDVDLDDGLVIWRNEGATGDGEDDVIHGIWVYEEQHRQRISETMQKLIGISDPNPSPGREPTPAPLPPSISHPVPRVPILQPGQQMTVEDLFNLSSSTHTEAPPNVSELPMPAASIHQQGYPTQRDQQPHQQQQSREQREPERELVRSPDPEELPKGMALLDSLFQKAGLNNGAKPSGVSSAQSPPHQPAPASNNENGNGGGGGGSHRQRRRSSSGGEDSRHHHQSQPQQQQQYQPQSQQQAQQQQQYQHGLPAPAHSGASHGQPSPQQPQHQQSPPQQQPPQQQQYYQPQQQYPQHQPQATARNPSHSRRSSGGSAHSQNAGPGGPGGQQMVPAPIPMGLQNPEEARMGILTLINHPAAQSGGPGSQGSPTGGYMAGYQQQQAYVGGNPGAGQGTPPSYGPLTYSQTQNKQQWAPAGAQSSPQQPGSAGHHQGSPGQQGVQQGGHRDSQDGPGSPRMGGMTYGNQRSPPAQYQHYNQPQQGQPGGPQGGQQPSAKAQFATNVWPLDNLPKRALSPLNPLAQQQGKANGHGRGGGGGYYTQPLPGPQGYGQQQAYPQQLSQQHLQQQQAQQAQQQQAYYSPPQVNDSSRPRRESNPNQGPQGSSGGQSSQGQGQGGPGSGALTPSGGAGGGRGGGFSPKYAADAVDEGLMGVGGLAEDDGGSLEKREFKERVVELLKTNPHFLDAVYSRYLRRCAEDRL